jgi:hypothetical protein
MNSDRFAHEFIGSGAMDGRFAHEFIGSEALDGRFAHEFVGSGAMDSRFGHQHGTDKRADNAPPGGHALLQVRCKCCTTWLRFSIVMMHDCRFPILRYETDRPIREYGTCVVIVIPLGVNEAHMFHIHGQSSAPPAAKECVHGGVIAASVSHHRF